MADEPGHPTEPAPRMSGLQRCLLACALTGSSYIAYAILIQALVIFTKLTWDGGTWVFLLLAVVVACVGCYLGLCIAVRRQVWVERGIVSAGALGLLGVIPFGLPGVGLLSLVLSLNVVKGTRYARFLQTTVETPEPERRQAEMAILWLIVVEPGAVVAGAWVGV